MPKLTYRARSFTGDIVDGSMSAKTVDELRVRLSVKGFELLNVREAAGGARQEGASWQDTFSMRPVRAVDLCNITGQLGLMLETGSALYESLEALAEQNAGSKIGEVLKTLAVDVSGGSTLTDALANHPRVFGNYYVAAARAGESTGNLPAVFERLETSMHKRIQLTAGVRAALVYPTILTFVAISAVIFLVLYVMPKFTAIFESSGVPLPLPTRILMQMAAIGTGYWHVMLVIILLVVVLSVMYFRSPTGKRQFDSLVLMLPFVGTVTKAVQTSSLLRMFGTLLEASVPLTEALAVAEQACGNTHFQEAVAVMTSGIIRGEGLATGFAKSALFTPSLKHMIATGERTGSLALVMTRTADHMDQGIDIQVRKVTSMLEPIIIIVMGVAVGFIAVSILLPLFQLSSAIRGA